MKRNNWMMWLVIATMTILLTACGGGGGGGTDTTKPVITILGDNPATVVLNTGYTDAGATAVDDVDGNVTVTGSGAVDTTMVGTYTITYSATDTAGNTATATRTVNVVATPDTTAPVITVIGDNPATVMQFSAYTDAGATAIDNIDGTVTVTTTSDVNASQVGSYTVTYSATDGAGNTATKTRTVTVIAFSVTHNGITYGGVQSPYTGKVWLDRNIGAARVCQTFDDTACYGDYYQWGRNTDGHEDFRSDTTTTLATAMYPVQPTSIADKFIINNSNPHDWVASGVDDDGATRIANWSKTDGSSVCPEGFRVPTAEELSAELLDTGSAEIQNREDAFNSFLKLPSAGTRTSSMLNLDAAGYISASSIQGSNSKLLYFGSANNAQITTGYIYPGRSVRCIQN